MEDKKLKTESEIFPGTMEQLNDITINKKLTTQEQIDWLNSFSQKWSDLDLIMDETERFLQEGNLQAEYDAFLLENNLPSISADDLAADLSEKEQSDALAREEFEKNKPEKTAFNDANMFVEEFKDYLIGKKIDYNDEENKAGTTDIIINVENENGNILLTLEKVGGIFVYEESYQDLIDGKTINPTAGEYLTLILQDNSQEDLSVEEPLINQPEYNYYLLNIPKKKITQGFEYKEDAMDHYMDASFVTVKAANPEDYAVHSKRELIKLGVDPNDNLNWLNELSDYSIIEEAVRFGVTEGDYDEQSAMAYIDKYKNEGKFSSVIKARLVYYMEHADKHFKNAIVFSEYEKALRFKEIKERTMNELLSIIKKDM